MSQKTMPNKKRATRRVTPARQPAVPSEVKLKQWVKEAVREVLDERARQAEQSEDAWDRQIEADLLAGRLDHLADQALAQQRAGQAREL